MASNSALTERFALTSKQLWIVFVSVFIFSLAFAAYTQSVWDDEYITFRISKNIAMGHGAVYTIGEKLHVFTSPLGTLIPAFLSFVTGNNYDELALWLFRVINCGLLGLSSVMLLKIANSLGMFLFPTTLMVGLFALDAKIVLFSTTGMETAYMMFFLVSTLYILNVPSKRFILILGLSWAGMMWTRPDSFVYIGGLAFSYILFNPRSPNFKSRKEMTKKFASSSIVTTVLYLPWILWTWNYYGTLIPHTIIAKGLFIAKPDFHIILQFVEFLVPSLLDISIKYTFLPPYYYAGGWPNIILLVFALLAYVCSYYWCLPFTSPLGRAISFALFIAHFYLERFPSSVQHIMPWYIPSVTLLSIFIIGLIAQQGTVIVRNLEEGHHAMLHKAAKNVLYICGVIILSLSFLLRGLVGYQTRIHHEVIEINQVKKIGLWLKENAVSPKDRVFVECLGYIGYYSQLKFLDFPGLASTEVVEARRLLQTDDYAPIINALRPEWLVLREPEVEMINKQMPLMLSSYYEPVKEFDVTEKLNAYSYIPARQIVALDRKFTVFRVMKRAEKS